MSATEFVIDRATARTCSDALTASLSAREERGHHERRVWLDTHDWRLFRAGLLLEHHVLSRRAWLVLSDLEEHRISRLPAGRAAISADSIPEGALRDRVLPLIGIRALLPRATASGPVKVLAVKDDEEKTVARVSLEGPTTLTDGDELGMRARVEPLRGYDKDAVRVARRLDKLTGFEPADRPLFESVFPTRGLDPRGFRVKPRLDFDPMMPVGEAFGDTLGQLLEIVRDNVDGTLKSSTPSSSTI